MNKAVLQRRLLSTSLAVVAPMIACDPQSEKSTAPSASSSSQAAPRPSQSAPAAGAIASTSPSAVAATLPPASRMRVGTGKIVRTPQLVATGLEFDAATGTIKPKSTTATPKEGHFFCVVPVTFTNPLKRKVEQKGEAISIRDSDGREVGAFSKLSDQPAQTPYLPSPSSSLDLRPGETKTDLYLLSVKKGTRELTIRNGSGDATKFVCAE